MKLYKIAQSLELRQTPNRFSGTILPQSSQIMTELKIEDALENLAKANGFVTALDYVLCSLYPEYVEACKQFYNDYEKGLEEIVKPSVINQIDNVIAQALVVFWKELKKEASNVWELTKTAQEEPLKWYPNKDDLKKDFFGHTYKIEVGVHNDYVFIINASGVGLAIDIMTDYMAKEFPHTIIPKEVVENLDPNVDPSYITGPYSGITINFSNQQMHVVELNEAQRKDMLEEMEEEMEEEESPSLKTKMMNFLKSQFGDEEEMDNEAEIAIYWFASNWHEGQASELYSILSTSPYHPGSLTSFDTEDDTVKNMYYMLEDEFAELAPKTLDSLKSDALESCNFRDHEMGEWEDDNATDPQTSISHCEICGKYVQVNLKPAPNQIDIGGDAVALYCKPLYGLATPEELYRELGIGGPKSNENL